MKNLKDKKDKLSHVRVAHENHRLMRKFWVDNPQHATMFEAFNVVIEAGLNALGYKDNGKN